MRVRVIRRVHGTIRVGADSMSGNYLLTAEDARSAGGGDRGMAMIFGSEQGAIAACSLEVLLLQ